MTPYYQDEWATIYHGDCREVLPTFDDASVDFIFTDPPYGHNNNNGDLAHRREAALGILPPGASAPEARPIANDGPQANDLVRWFYDEAYRLLMADMTIILLVLGLACGVAALVVLALDRYLERRHARRLDQDDTARIAAARVDDDCAASLDNVRQVARFQQWVDDHEYRPRAS